MVDRLQKPPILDNDASAPAQPDPKVNVLDGHQ